MYLEYLIRFNYNMSGSRFTEQVSSEEEAIKFLKDRESDDDIEIWGASLYQDAEKKIKIKDLRK